MYSKTSPSGTLTKWDTSPSGTIFAAPKPKMSLTKWGTLLFETSPAFVFIIFQEKSVFFAEVGDNIKPMSNRRISNRM